MKINKLIAISASLALFATPAMAWTSWGTADGNSNMQMSHNTGGYNGNDDAYATVVRAAKSWNAPTCSNFSFSRNNPAIVDRSVPVRDSRNHIVFGEAGSGALAVTYLLANSSNRECDVIMDDDVTWNIGPGSSSFREYDMEGVYCHELGHVLGLGHSNTSAATMYYAIGGGDDTKRSLHSDDENGVCSRY
jgi:hypothetical protein